MTKCFYNKKKYSSYENLKKFRERLLQNKKTIKVTDFGAGSRIFSSEERKISIMAKKVGMNPKRARLLNRLIPYLNIESALELGTSLGISTAAMAMGNDVKIITMEGCPETAKTAQENFDVFRLDNIELEVGEFDVLLKREIEQREENKEQREENKEQREENKEQRGGNREQREGNREKREGNREIPPISDFTNHESRITNPKPTNNRQQTFDLIFFDGNHQKEATLSYFEKLLPLAHNDSVFIFDDIHWSRGMEEAWKEITAHPKVKVSIDTFQWGFVFFRKEQEKQHFVVRV